MYTLNKIQLNVGQSDAFLVLFVETDTDKHPANDENSGQKCNNII